MNDKKFINSFSLNIGQRAIGGIPLGEAFMQVIVNDHYVTCRLNDIKDWIDTIVMSNGDRNEKAYEAKDNLTQLFVSLLHPWMKLPELPK